MISYNTNASEFNNTLVISTIYERKSLFLYRAYIVRRLYIYYYIILYYSNLLFIFYCSIIPIYIINY